MLRWLSSLEAVALFPLVAAVGVGLTFLLDKLRRRFVAPETRARASATASVTLQVTATIYAILAAFVIVDAYTQLRDTQSQVAQKAAALSTIYQNSRALPDSDAEDIRSATLVYAQAVVRFGFPKLEDSAEADNRSAGALRQLFETVQAAEPETAAATSAYDAIVSNVDTVEATRQQLLNAARSSVPPALVWLLVGIGLVVMGIATMLDTRHHRSHLLILSALALVIWLTIALVLSMDYPFGGAIRVSDAPIREFLEVSLAG